MREFGLAVLATVLLAQCAQAERLEIFNKIPLKSCQEGCAEAITGPGATFSDYDLTLPEDSSYYAYCVSDLFLVSFAACGQIHCSEKQIEAGWNNQAGYCSTYGNLTMAPYEQYKDKATAVRDSLEKVDTIANAAIVYNNSILPTEDAYTLSYRTVSTWDQEEVYHHAFGYALLIFLGVMIAIGVLFRFFSWVTWRGHKTDEPSLGSEIALSDSKSSRFGTLYKKYFGLPALFGNRHGRPAWFMFSIPTRLQFFWVAFYVILNIIFTSVGYEAFLGNLYFTEAPANTKGDQYARYLSDRTGIMCFYNMPLLWLLAGRNDFVIWLTGTTFSTLNLYHRWVARVAVLQAIVHSAGYTYYYIRGGWYKEEWPGSTGLWWRTGIFATVVWCLIIAMSILPIRQHYYEIFLIFHILAAAASLALLFYHVQVFEDQYNPYVWACVAIWVFDRVARYVRLSVFSYNAITDNNAEAVVTGGEHGLIRLTVTAPFNFTPQAGSYYFLYSPATLTPWENHPFTLASWEQENGETKLHFLIAVQTGATRRLRRKIKETPTRMRVLLEGPYGHREPVDRFEHVLLVAGGSGITAVLPYLEMLKNSKFTKTISLIWSVKNNAYTTDVMQRELSNCGADVTIHITEEDQPAGAVLPEIGGTAIQENKEKHSDQGSSAPGISVVVGRPVMEKEINFHAERVVGSERLAVLCCGPGGMIDDTRKAIVHSLGNEDGKIRGSSIEYFEELFSW